MSADSPRRGLNARCGGLSVPAIVPPQVVSDRSILDSAIGFINEVTLAHQPHTDPKDTITWARFESMADISDPRFGEDWELEGNVAPPLLLILGYGLGVQVWAIPANGEAVEVLSWRHGSVTALRVLPTPAAGTEDTGRRADELVDIFAEKRPLMAMCDGGGSKSAVGSQTQFCAVNFVSLKTGTQVKTIKFKNSVLDILANRTSIAVTFNERIAVFDARTLEDRLSITTCYPSPGINPNPVALGSRWLAYAEHKLLHSKRSGGGCDGEGVASYTATVLNAAKSFGKGLRELGEQVAAGLTGVTTTGGSGNNSKNSSFDSNSSGDMRQPGIVTVIDIKHPIKDVSPTSGTPISINGSDPFVAHFIAHSEAVVAMEFDNSGMLLVTADKRGHDFHVFRIQPHPVGSSLAAVHHLYVLHRGDTSAKVQNIAYSLDSRWVAVSTLRGTTHVFPITPYGGAMGVRTHTSLHVVNKLSRFHRSAGLSAEGRSSSPISHSESTTFSQSLIPYHNPTLPPYTRPTVVLPLAQLRQPFVLGSPPGSVVPSSKPGSGGAGTGSASSQRQRLSSLSDDNGKPLSVCAIFAKSRSWLLDPPNATREAPHRMQRKAVDSLFVMAGHGALIQYDLDTRLASNVAKEKLCDETPIELEVEAKAQWNLWRKDGSQEIMPPLTSDNWLIKNRNSCMLTDSTRQFDDTDDRVDSWLSQVEIITHAGPHRRLWMGPQFVFKTYNTPSGSNLSHIEAEAIEIGVTTTSATAAARAERSSPLNMPLSAAARASVPVLIESGSYSSIEQSPKLMDRFRHDHLDSDFSVSHGDSRLKEDLADAMRESPSVSKDVTGRLLSDTAFESAPFYDALAEHIEEDNLDSRRSAAAALAHALPNIYSYAAYSSHEAPLPPRSIEKVVNPLGTVTTIIAGMSSELSTDILDEVVSQLAAEDCVIHENCDESLFRPVVAIFCDEKSRMQGEEARRQQELCKPPEMVGNKLIVPVIDKERDDELCKKEKQKSEEGRVGGCVTAAGVKEKEQLSKEDQRKFAELAQMSKKCQVANLGKEQKDGAASKQNLQDQNADKASKEAAKCLQNQKSEKRDIRFPEALKKTTKSCEKVKEKPKLAENIEEIQSSSKDSTDRYEVKKLSKTTIKKELRKSLERDEFKQKEKNEDYVEKTLANLKKENQIRGKTGTAERNSEEREVKSMEHKNEFIVETRGTQKTKDLVGTKQLKSEEREEKELERHLIPENKLKEKGKNKNVTQKYAEEDQIEAEEKDSPNEKMILTNEKTEYFQRKSEELEQEKIASNNEIKIQGEKEERPIEFIRITPLLVDKSTKKTAENANISANIITANAENINSKPKTKTAKQPEEVLVLKSSGKETNQSPEVGASASKTMKLKDTVKATSCTKRAEVKTGQINAEDLEDSLAELDKQHATKDSQKQKDSVLTTILREKKDEVSSSKTNAVVELNEPVDVFANEIKTSKKKKQKLNKSASNSESEEVVEVIKTTKITKTKSKKSDVSEKPLVLEKKSSISSEDSFPDLPNSLLEKNQNIEQTMYISFSEIMEKEVNARFVDQTDSTNKSSAESFTTNYVTESKKSSKDASKKIKAGRDSITSITEKKTNANLIKYEDLNKEVDKNKESVASTNLLLTLPKPTKETIRADKGKSMDAVAINIYDKLNDDALKAHTNKKDSKEKVNVDKGVLPVKPKDIHDSQAQLKSKTERENQDCVVSPFVEELKKDHSRANKEEENRLDNSKGVVQKQNLKRTNLEDNDSVELLKFKGALQSELYSRESPQKSKKDETSKESKINFKQPSGDQLTTMTNKKNMAEVLRDEREIMPPQIKPALALTDTKKSKKGKVDNKQPEVTYAITEQPKRTKKEDQKEGLKYKQDSHDETDAASTIDSNKSKFKNSEKCNAETSEDINKKSEAKDETLVFFEKFSPDHKNKTTVEPPKTTEILKPASAWQTMSGAAMINKNLESFANATVEENYPFLGSIGKTNNKKSKASIIAEERKLSLKEPLLPTNVKNTPILQDEPLSTPAQKHKKSRKPLGTTFDDFAMIKTLDDLPPLPQLEPLELTTFEKSDKLALIGESQVSLINFESPKQENPTLMQKITPPPRGFTEQNLIFALCGSLHYENENGSTAYKSLIENINDEQYMSLEQSSQGTTTNEKSSSTSSTSSSASDEAVVGDLGEKKFNIKLKARQEQGLELLKQKQQKKERQIAKERVTDAEDADNDDDDEELQPLISMSESKMDNYADPMMLESKNDHFANNKSGASGVTTTDSEGPMAATTPSDDNNYNCFRVTTANTTTASIGNKLKTKKLEHKINLIAAIEAATSSSTSSAEESGVEGSNRGGLNGTGDTAVVTMSASTTAAVGGIASSIPSYAGATAQLSASKKKTKRRKR